MRTQLAAYVLVGLSLATTTVRPAEAQWLVDFKEAKTRAKAENKRLLIEFTGSDWCAWCTKLDEEVLSRPEFESYAQKQFILVKVDFPRQQPLQKSQAKANQKLMEQFEVLGFPTLIVADPTGKELGRVGYVAGGPSRLNGSLQAIVQGSAKTEAPSMTVQARESRPAPSASTPQSSRTSSASVSTGEGTSLDGLVLQGLSGPANRRLALINNQTVSTGESIRVRVGRREVRVRCLAIKEESVLISVDGSTTPQELRWRGGL